MIAHKRPRRRQIHIHGSFHDKSSLIERRHKSPISNQIQMEASAEIVLIKAQTMQYIYIYIYIQIYLDFLLLPLTLLPLLSLLSPYLIICQRYEASNEARSG